MIGEPGGAPIITAAQQRMEEDDDSGFRGSFEASGSSFSLRSEVVVANAFRAHLDFLAPTNVLKHMFEVILEVLCSNNE